MIDEAHATGVLGPGGRGAVRLYSLETRVPVVMSTLSKALGSLGGFVTGSRKFVEYLMNTSRHFIFDTSLLDIPRIKDTIKEGVIIIANSPIPINTSEFPDNVKVYIVDATGICIKREFMHSSGPILNIPMLGAFGKVTGYYDLEIMEKVLKKEFGEKKLEKNMSVATDAYESVKEV